MALAVLAMGLLASGAGVTAREATPVSQPDAPITRCAELMAIGNASDACITFVHTVEGAPEFDVHIDKALLVEQLSFGEVSGYLVVPAGSHRIEFFGFGSSDGEPLSWLPDATFEQGVACEIAILGGEGSLQAGIFAVDLAPVTPPKDDFPAENTRIRFVQAAPAEQTVSVTMIAGDIAERILEDLGFAEASDYVEKPAGFYQLKFQLNEPDGLLSLGTIQFEGNAVYTVYAVGSLANGELEALPVMIDLGTGKFTSRDE